MNKKIMLLALAVASTAAVMVPATASAEIESLHINPTPAKIDIVGGTRILRMSIGTVTCNGVVGTMAPEAGGTTGTVQLTYGPDCTGPSGGSCTSSNPVEPTGSISTTVLSYHLVTIDNGTPVAPSPGILVTPNAATSTFSHVNCIVLGFPVQVTVEANGVLGTITAPACGGKAKKSTVKFEAVPATTTQKHRFTHNKNSNNTTGPWSLTQGGNPASVEMQWTLTNTNAAGAEIESELVCT